MKNFRKVLALVLVVATLFSFAAMASAKTYTDDANISYDEAVAVLSHVGILNGYEDDSFKPTNTISREEMAKMIAVLANAGSDVSSLYASACTFADVPASKWSASYVAYCAKTGIVAGRSASTFDPAGKVTGLETAKMLLVVLGFEADEQGYVGADWKVNVLRDAKVMGLLNGFAAGYDIEAPITREQAAQMMLNALEAPCVVGFLSNDKITVTNALIFGDDSKYDPDFLGTLVDVLAYAKLKDAIKAGKWCLFGNVVISDDLLCEKLFGLKKIAHDGDDCYMRPSSGWTWVDAKGNIVPITGTAYAPVFSSYNTTEKEIADFLDDYSDKYYVTRYINGKDAASAEMGGKGALVEIYEIGTELRVIEIQTYFNKIVEVDTYDREVKIGSGTYKNDLGFKTADEGKYVLYWTCNGACDKDHDNLHAAEIVTPAATATVTKAVKNNKTDDCYFIAGEKYEYAKTFDVTILAGLPVMGEAGYGVGEKFDIYTDKYGFVMFYAPVAAAGPEYKYGVVDYGSANAYFGSYNKLNGSNWTYKIAMVDFEKNPAVGDAVAANKAMFDRVDNSKFGSDTLVKYYIDADGNYCVDETVNDNRDYAADVVLEAADDVKVDGKWLSTDTQILLRVENPMNGKTEYKYFDGCDELDAKYSVQNLGYYYDGNYMTYVYGEATYAYTSGAAYLMDEAESVVWLTDGNKVVGYNTYAAMVDGEEAIIATNNGIIFDDAADFNKVYNLEMVQIGLTTDDKAPVYVAVSVAAPLPSKTIETLSVDKYGKLFYGDEYVGKIDAKADFVLFTFAWSSDDAYVVVDAAELTEYVSNWDHAQVWTFDTDADGDIDLLYVNAVDGD